MKQIIGTTCLIVAGSCSAQAAVVLTVDVSNPAVVVLTASGANSGVAVSSDVFDGFTLSNFFTADPSGNFASSSLSAGSLSAGLKGGDASLEYDLAQVDLASSVGLWITGSSEAMSFSTGSAAFTGSAALDLNTASGFLPVSGSGPLVVWDTELNAVEIGTWQISAVPEPSSYVAVIGFGLMGLSAYRRVRGTSR
jgi:hypothetical protein